jgi:hypothetical protein
VLSNNDRSGFEQDGYLRVGSALSPGQAAAMTEAVWAALGHQGIRRDDRATWRQPPAGALRQVTRSGALAVTGPLLTAIGEVSGPDAALAYWGQPLVTFPAPGARWTVPHQAWHTDFPAAAAMEMPGLLVVWFLRPVRASGGGTVILAGSHHLVRRITRSAPQGTWRSADITRKGRLAESASVEEKR